MCTDKPFLPRTPFSSELQDSPHLLLTLPFYRRSRLLLTIQGLPPSTKLDIALSHTTKLTNASKRRAKRTLNVASWLRSTALSVLWNGLRLGMRLVRMVHGWANTKVTAISIIIMIIIIIIIIEY
jgi:hypothetical protein